MNFGEFMASLNRGEPKPVYLLAGEEEYFIKKAKERLLSLLTQTADAATENLDGNVSPDDIIAAVSSISFFATKTIVLVNNPLFLRTKKSAADDAAKDTPQDTGDKRLERLIKFLPHIPPGNHIIFKFAGKTDKRKSIVKAIAKYGAVLDADRVSPWNINGFLQSKLQEIHRELTPDAHAFFAEAVSFMNPVSLSFLDNEFDKLALFAENRRITKQELAESFAGVPEISNFAVADAIVRRDLPTALKLLLQQMTNGVFMPLVLAVVVNQVRRLLQIKELQKKRASAADIAKALNMNPYIVGKQLKAVEAFDADRLADALCELAEADYRLKTGGDGNNLLLSAVIKLCRR